MSKYLSRKFLLTVTILLLSSALPVIYKNSQVSDSVMLAVLAILAGVGTAYGFLNLKEANIDQPK